MNIWVVLAPALIILLALKYLLLQAFFHDVKLGITWLAAFIIGTASTVFPETISAIVMILASIIYFVLFMVFVCANFKKTFVYVPLSTIVVALAPILWALAFVDEFNV